MSKVMLGEFVFETWYGGRAVLLGDGMMSFYAQLIRQREEKKEKI